MIVGVPREAYPGERRVALVPSVVPALIKAGHGVRIEAGAGAEAGCPDEQYVGSGARIAPSRRELFAAADAVIQVLGHGANDKTGRDDLPLLRRDQIVIGFMRSLGSPETVRDIALTGATAFAVELMPRITRAQSMDSLSAMSTVVGYCAVLLAASTAPKMFPMLMTAAGTITPARVLVIGAGVAGLQAIATARRLGAVVSAYDVRPAAKEQVISLGARFVELPLETSDTQDSRGYARAQDEAFYQRQRELMARAVAESDVVIATAAVPGKKAPVLITAEMVAGMAPGSVIVDVAAEQGGNCALTRPRETVVERGVTVLGPVNLASTAPATASQLYARTVSAFFLHLTRGGALTLEDEIARETLVARWGEVVQPRIREALGLAPLAASGARRPAGAV